MSHIAPSWVAFSSLWSSGAACLLFYLLAREKREISGNYPRLVFVYVLFLGTMIRLFLLYGTPGNYDTVSWQKAAEIFARGGNIYAETQRYNYTPIWFWILGILPSAISPRLLLTGTDIITALILFKWPKRSSWERTCMAAFFYLNPVSFLLTGVHGHFDNLAVLFLLMALRSERAGVLWAFVTTAFLVKQIVFYEVIVVVLNAFKVWWKRVWLLSLSVFLFFLCFASYWRGGSEGIINNVFLYRSYSMPYGFSALNGGPWLTFLFIIALCFYPFWIRKKELHHQMLLGVLFFLTFTTGLGVQYFILPIALGAFRPRKGFFIYSVITTLYLFGSYFNMDIRFFSWMSLWAVWVSAAFWWLEASRAG